MALTKADISARVARELETDQQHARALVDSFFEEVREKLEAGMVVKLSGFGNFELRDKPARPGRNPKTGKEVTIAPRRVVTFRSGQKLKMIVTE